MTILNDQTQAALKQSIVALEAVQQSVHSQTAADGPWDSDWDDIVSMTQESIPFVVEAASMAAAPFTDPYDKLRAYVDSVVGQLQRMHAMGEASLKNLRIISGDPKSTITWT